MIIFRKNFILSIIAFASVFSSYFIEYYLQIIPCFLCLIIRKIFILLFIVSFFYSLILYHDIYKKYHKIIALLIKATLISILSISCYHLLVEYGIFELKCIANNIGDISMQNLSIEQIKEKLFINISPPCNIAYSIFGTSLVLLVFLLSFSLSVYYFLL